MSSVSHPVRSPELAKAQPPPPPCLSPPPSPPSGPVPSPGSGPCLHTHPRPLQTPDQVDLPTACAPSFSLLSAAPDGPQAKVPTTTSLTRIFVSHGADKEVPVERVPGQEGPFYLRSLATSDPTRPEGCHGRPTRGSRGLDGHPSVPGHPGRGVQSGRTKGSVHDQDL